MSAFNSASRSSRKGSCTMASTLCTSDGTRSGCDTGVTLMTMPTRRRRHAITETPPVQAALDELREALGAEQKLARVQADRDDTAALRRRLADRIRRREIPADRAAADEVRRAGWARP